MEADPSFTDLRFPLSAGDDPVRGVARQSLPPLDVIGPDGHRITLRALDRDDTVAALADRLGAPGLCIPERSLLDDERLATIEELRVGVRLDAAPTSSSPPWTGGDSDVQFDREAGADAVVEVAVVTGPSATDWVPLAPGRHLLGRAPHAAVRLDDPTVEPHHALLLVSIHGDVEMVQLSGAVPVRIEGRPLEFGATIAMGDRAVVGSSTIRFRAPRLDRSGPSIGAVGTNGLGVVRSELGSGGTIAEHPTDPWRRIVWRAPYQPPSWSTQPVVAPVAAKEPQRPALTGLIGVGVTAMGAVVIARVMGNAMFMLFAAMALIGSLTTFAVGTITARRKRSKLRKEHAERVDAFRDSVEQLHARRRIHHQAGHRSILETQAEAFGDGSRIWQRRVDRDTDAAPLCAVVGRGTHRWRPEIEVRDPNALDPSLMQRVEASARLIGVAAPVSIRPGDAIALHGAIDSARSVARSLVAQLATWVGPADWQLVVVTRDARTWSWVDWLPHGALDGASLVVVGSDSDGLGDTLEAVDTVRTTVLITDEPSLFTARTGALRRFVSASDAAALVVVDTESTVPAMCRRILTIGSTGSATWSGEVPDHDDSTAIEFAGISTDTADRIARRLACLVDPEDDGGSGGGVPNSVTLGELLPSAETTAEAIAKRWRDGGADPAPAAPLGSSTDGRIDIDLVRDGPHGLIAGTTGAGKSELLRTLVVSLAASVGPQHLNFVLVDYKGGSTFDACTALPHTVGLVTDLDDGLAERALVSLDAELHRRERMLRTVGAADLTDYRSRRDGDGRPPEPIARLVVVIDEFAALAKELPDFLNALVGIAQRGRSLGVHLLLATQRPAGVVNDDIRANTNLRLALRLHDRPDAMDVVGDELPAKFPRGLPGRAALRLGPDELVVFQAARCTGPVAQVAGGGMVVERALEPVGVATRRCPLTPPSTSDAVEDADRSELEVTVDAIVAAARADALEAPHRPWVDPLPFPLEEREDETGEGISAPTSASAIGVVDDPEHQRRVPLAWRPEDGSLALVGSIGSGTTWTMISIAAAICRSTSPDDLHLYVIDARGDDGLTALSTLAHCGGVVRASEDERLHRLLRRVVDELDGRLAGNGDQGPDIVVMIDGYASVRNALGAIERQATFDLLQRVVNDGPAARVVAVLADDANSAMTMAPVAHRWFFHLDDPGAARGLGLRAAPVPHGKPGRLRILACGREAQVTRGAAGLAEIPGRGDVVGGPEPIVALPEAVDAASIEGADPLGGGGSGTVSLPVGISSTDLGVARLDLVDGDHVVIVGSPRTGVSTALARCVAGWRADAHRRGTPFEIVEVDRRTPLDPEAIADPAVRVCVRVDDAHRIDDSGLLAAIAKGEHPHVTIFAGGRADAIRGSYGHWTREVAKARCGIILTSRGDPDGDLLGAQVPRRSLIPARPGLGWLVDGGPLRLAQIATD